MRTCPGTRRANRNTGPHPNALDCNSVRIFTRYIWHEVLSHALLGGALFTFILFMKYLGQLLEMAARNSASLGSVAKIFLFMLPNILSFTIPMAVLVGVLLGLSRLSSDSEITAMRAVGIGVWFFVRVVSAIAIIGWGISLADSLYVAPKATAALLRLENSLKDQQASFEVEPRVFYEDFKNYVLYVQDIRAGAGVSHWQRVFLADLSDPLEPKVTTAEEAVVADRGAHIILMRLRNGTEHEIVINNGAPQYQVSTFLESELPLDIGTQEDTHIGHNDTPILAMSNRALYERTKAPGGKPYLIELHKRFAYPAACLVLMLIGIPLGLSSRRGGKSAGFVVTIALVFIYYFLSSSGIALAREGKVPVYAGVWAANILFAFFGLLLLRQMAVGGGMGTQFAAMVSRFKSTQLPNPRNARRKEETQCARARSLSAHSRRLRAARVSDYLCPGAVQLCAPDAGIHLFRAAGRHHTQPHSVGHRRRIPHRPHPEHDLPHHAARSIGRRAGHVWRAHPNQRVHRHEGYRHQPVPGDDSHPGGCGDDCRRPYSSSTSPTCRARTGGRRHCAA